MRGVADPAQIADAEQFRQDFGLRSDAAYVAGTFVDSSYSAEAYGYPLDSKEEADLDRRAAPDLSALLKRGRDDTDSFGGAWIDQAKGGLVHIQLVGDAPPSDWVSLVPTGLDLVIDRVDHTQAERASDSSGVCVHDSGDAT